MNPCVLLVDDEPNVLKALRRVLRGSEYDVLTAEGGDAALALLDGREFAVVVCDQRMPGLSGPEVLAAVRDRQPDAYRVALTGYADLALARAAINEGGVQQFLLKPWDDDHLRDVIRQGVEAYQLIQDHRRLEELTRQQKQELETWNKRLEEQVWERTQELRAQNSQLLQLQRRLEHQLHDTVAVLAGMLEAYDASLGIHSKRVAELCRCLGEHLQLKEDALQDVRIAGYLHDLGKLTRIGKEAESPRRGAANWRRQTPRHSDCGAAILANVRGFEAVVCAIRHQGEHWDGGGYPEGLRGDRIPLGARLIAVANAYDKAVYPRAHPTRIDRAAGEQTLLHGRGSRFDPELVTLLLAHLDDARQRVRAGDEVELTISQVRPGMVLARELKNLEGVRLLAAGVELTDERIERIRSLGKVSPLLTRVFVRCAEPQAAAPTEDASSAPPAETASPPPADSTAFSASPPERPAAQAQPPGVTVQRVEVDAWEQAGGERRCCLVVDDSEFMRRALSRELRRAGFESVATGDGRDALALVRGQSFDAALIDLAMPHLSGVELVRQLHELAPALPCVIVTGNATREDVALLSKAPNVAGILAKPWDHDRLISAIQSAIAAAPAAR